eukprot:2246438-Rhodomonas_salina.4
MGRAGALLRRRRLASTSADPPQVTCPRSVQPRALAQYNHVPSLSTGRVPVLSRRSLSTTHPSSVPVLVPRPSLSTAHVCTGPESHPGGSRSEGAARPRSPDPICYLTTAHRLAPYASSVPHTA